MTTKGFPLVRLAIATTVGLASVTPARAQEEDYERIVMIMRACAQIEDMVARVTCYDNNIGERPAPAAASSLPTPPPAQPRSEAALPPSAPSFGEEMLPQERDRRAAERPDSAELRVVAAERQEPGIYIITLADGAQWRFVDSAGLSYQVPREGDLVRLERAALGSVRMIYAGQRGLRVRRVR